MSTSETWERLLWVVKKRGVVHLARAAIRQRRSERTRRSSFNFAQEPGIFSIRETKTLASAFPSAAVLRFKGGLYPGLFREAKAYFGVKGTG